MIQQGRLDGIDFWRGFVLCVIFADHMPGNAFENLTPRNFGFSDAAEAFVFLSGVSIAAAYGGRFKVGQRLSTALIMARRVLKLYGVHLALSAAALMIFFAGAALVGKPDLLEPHGRSLFVQNPGLGVLGVVSLGHQLGYFNILPLYMILVACAPILLWLAGIDCRLMLACSAIVYALFRGFGWNLPNWPAPGAWFFDPFAWQLLFSIGVAVGLKRNLLPTLLLPKSLLAVAALVVAASAAVVTGGFGISHHAGDVARAGLDLDKTQLGAARLVHFIALAYLVYALGLTERLRRFALYRPLALLGRHSLWVFALVSLCSAVWQVLAVTGGRTLWFDAAYLAASLALIYAATLLLERHSHPATRRAAAKPPLALAPSA